MGIFDALLAQIKFYYLNKNAAIQKYKHFACALNFDNCFDDKTKERIVEPLPALLMICSELILWHELNGFDFNELYKAMKDDFDNEKERYLASLADQPSIAS